jgi:EpsI family protein
MDSDRASPAIKITPPTSHVWSLHLRAPFALMLMITAALVVFYWPTWVYLAGRWTDWPGGEYTHGLLVVAISCSFAFKLGRQLSSDDLAPSLSALTALVLLSLGWSVSRLLGITSLQAVALGFMLPTAIAAAAGFRAVWHLRFPLGFLLLAFPLWSFLLPVMRDLTTSVSVIVVRLLGVPVFSQFHNVSIPEGEFLVEAGCSGLRYMLAAAAIGLFYVQVNRISWEKGVLFVASLIGLAILANLIRVTTVIYVGHLTQMQHPWIHDHLHLGWYVFAVFCGPALWFGPRSADEGSYAAIGGKDDVAPYDGLWILVPITIVLMAGPVSYTYLSRTQPTSGTGDLNVPAVTDWHIESDLKDSWRPVYKGADAVIQASYRLDNRRVYLYMAQYDWQTGGHDKELTSYRNRVFDGENWFLLREGSALSVRLADQRRFDVIETVISSGKDDRLVWHWYEVGGSATNRPILVKWYELLGLFGKQRGSMAVAVSTDFLISTQGARERLAEFVTVLRPVRE